MQSRSRWALPLGQTISPVAARHAEKVNGQKGLQQLQLQLRVFVSGLQRSAC
jgi:hypothetical protein